MTVDAKIEQQYKDLLLEARTTGSVTPISNRRPWHCALAVRELLELAAAKQAEATSQGESVSADIFTGSCTNRVYGGESLKPVDKLVRAGGRVRVIVSKDGLDRRNNELLRLAESYRHKLPGSVTFLVIDAKKSGLEKPSHFMVVAKVGYRIEAEHEPTACAGFDDFSPEIPARICFNDKSGGSALAFAFDGLWNSLKARGAEELPAARLPSGMA